MSALPANAKAARDLAGGWLAHLPRDPRGLPIPWINRWGAESAAATRVAYDPNIGRLAIFHDDYGDQPDFTRQNMGRQRHAVAAGLCQVCARPCPWSRRNLVVASATCETVHLEQLGRPAMAVVEPWLDDRCAAIAVQLCPALIRRRHDDDLTTIAVRSPKDVQIVVSVGRLDDTMTGVAHLAGHAGATLGMWAKIVLTGRDIVARGV